MFLNAIRVGDFIYGTTGDFGPAFLTALEKLPSPMYGGDLGEIFRRVG